MSGEGAGETPAADAVAAAPARGRRPQALPVEGADAAVMGCFGESPELLLRGTLGERSKNGGSFPSILLPDKNAGGPDMELVAVTMKRHSRTPEPSTRTGELCPA